MALSQTHIIIIDDTTQDDEALMEVLREHYEFVHLFAKGSECLKYFKDANNLNQNNLVLLDIQLPEMKMSGHETLAGIRQISHLIPVILWTNADRKDEFGDFINNEANGFIGKSASSQEILNKIQEIETKHIKNNGISAALEKWIYRQERGKLDKPYLIEANGKAYTLNDLLREIRLQTEVGRKFETDAYDMLIDILTDKQAENNG